MRGNVCYEAERRSNVSVPGTRLEMKHPYRAWSFSLSVKENDDASGSGSGYRAGNTGEWAQGVGARAVGVS